MRFSSANEDPNLTTHVSTTQTGCVPPRSTEHTDMGYGDTGQTFTNPARNPAPKEPSDTLLTGPQAEPSDPIPVSDLNRNSSVDKKDYSESSLHRGTSTKAEDSQERYYQDKPPTAPGRTSGEALRQPRSMARSWSYERLRPPSWSSNSLRQSSEYDHATGWIHHSRHMKMQYPYPGSAFPPTPRHRMPPTPPHSREPTPVRDQDYVPRSYPPSPAYSRSSSPQTAGYDGPRGPRRHPSVNYYQSSHSQPGQLHRSYTVQPSSPSSQTSHHPRRSYQSSQAQAAPIRRDRSETVYYFPRDQRHRPQSHYTIPEHKIPRPSSEPDDSRHSMRSRARSRSTRPSRGEPSKRHLSRSRGPNNMDGRSHKEHERGRSTQRRERPETPRERGRSRTRGGHTTDNINPTHNGENHSFWTEDNFRKYISGVIEQSRRGKNPEKEVARHAKAFVMKYKAGDEADRKKIQLDWDEGRFEIVSEKGLELLRKEGWY